MLKIRDVLMIAALALVVGFGTACFSFLADKNKPAGEADIPECAGLSGEPRIDCEARYKKP